MTLVPTVIGGDAAMLDRFTANAATLARMGKLAAPVSADAVPAGSAQIVVDGVTIAFPLDGAIDLDAEKARLAKAIAVAEKDRDGSRTRVGSTTRAPYRRRGPPSSAQIVVEGVTVAFPLRAQSISTPRSAAAKAIAAAEKDRDGLAARLNNPAFAERAKPEAVAKAREDHDARAAEAERLGAALARLGNCPSRGAATSIAPRATLTVTGVFAEISPSIEILSRGPRLEQHLAAAKLAGRAVARLQLEQGREPAPAQPPHARPGHCLDDDLAAVDFLAFDQFDPAVVGAIGDPRLGRPHLVDRPSSCWMVMRKGRKRSAQQSAQMR